MENCIRNHEAMETCYMAKEISSGTCNYLCFTRLFIGFISNELENIFLSGHLMEIILSVSEHRSEQTGASCPSILPYSLLFQI